MNNSRILKSAPLPVDGLFDKSVSLLCWAYNEELLIEDFLRRADTLMKASVKDYEIVVIDDCSTDNTNSIIKRLQETEIPNIRLFRNDTNRNVGYSSQRAIQEASKEFLFWQTIDWSYDISRLREFLELLKTFDIVAGVRRAPVSQKTLPGKILAGIFLLFGKHLTKRSDTVAKAIVSVCNYSLVRVLFRMPLSDYQNIVFYKTNFIKGVKVESQSSFANPEMLLKAYWSGASIAEVPISFIPRTAGEAKGTRLKAISRSISDVFGYWIKLVVLRGGGKVTLGRIARLDSSAWECCPQSRGIRYNGARQSMTLFDDLIAGISQKDVMQKKGIRKLLETCDRNYFNRAENFVRILKEYLEGKNLDLNYAADSYLSMCADIRRQQLLFARSGTYECKSIQDACANVYDDDGKMLSYMTGLAVSIFLWRNHYSMYDFFVRECGKFPAVKKYLEIGPGHGFYLAEAIGIFRDADFTAVDISDTSIRISRDIVSLSHKNKSCSFLKKNIMDMEGSNYDFITFCEVLEHLPETGAVLEKLRKSLNDRGRVFITTCANLPAVDHIYLYNSVGQIREELFAAGFAVVSEMALPVVENVPKSDWKTKKIGINYAAILKGT